MTVPAQATFDTSRVGVRVESPVIQITAEDTRRFAAATNDENPRAARRTRSRHRCTRWSRCSRRWCAAKNAVTHGLRVPRRARPDRARAAASPGLSVRVDATVVGVRQRSAGVATVVHIETRSAAGALLNEQYFTSFVSGGRVAASSRARRAVARPPQPAARRRARAVTLALDPDQTRRFAAAADDWDAYTLDEAVARSMGFPTIIVHGTCTMAFAARADRHDRRATAMRAGSSGSPRACRARCCSCPGRR